MKKSRYTEQQIAQALRQAEQGPPVAERRRGRRARHAGGGGQDLQPQPLEERGAVRDRPDRRGA